MCAMRYVFVRWHDRKNVLLRLLCVVSECSTSHVRVYILLFSSFILGYPVTQPMRSIDWCTAIDINGNWYSGYVCVYVVCMWQTESNIRIAKIAGRPFRTFHCTHSQSRIVKHVYICEQWPSLTSSNRSSSSIWTNHNRFGIYSMAVQFLFHFSLFGGCPLRGRACRM